MSNNEKVSDLIELDAPEIQSNDVLLVTDMSQLESKKLPVGQLLTYIESSGSFLAYYASNAATASYVLANNIAGIIPLAINSSQSISSSWSTLSNTSSYAINASSSSYSSFCVITSSTTNTASYLLYSGTPNGTASYAVNSGIANISQNAGFLIYNSGSNNGTASYAITSLSSLSSSYSTTASYINSSSYSVTSSFSSLAYNAQTASAYTGPRFGPTFINPVIIFSSSLATAFQRTPNLSSYIPSNTNVVILEAWATGYDITSPAFVYIRQDEINTASYVLLAYESPYYLYASSAQGSFPLSTVYPLTFQYNVTLPITGGGTVIRLIGYY
jgi:hypothetical protein